MNRFDKPLAATGSIIMIIAALGFVINQALAASGKGAILWPWLLVIALVGGGVLLVASTYSYRKPHLHTSTVSGLRTERHPREHKAGRSLQSVTEVYPEVAVMRLKSGGTYDLGQVNDMSAQELQIRIGDIVTVQRSWGAAHGHWHARVMSIMRADALNPMKKAAV